MFCVCFFCVFVCDVFFLFGGLEFHDLRFRLRLCSLGFGVLWFRFYCSQKQKACFKAR